MALCLATAPSSKLQAQDATRAVPEAATGNSDKKLARANRHMAAAAHPLAVQAGLEILRQGGSAVDAAITTQLVLNLVEPQSSGIGGGAFILHWDAGLQKLMSYDGRETAPAAATPDLFLKPDGKPMKFIDAITGGISVGVPGVLRALEMVHKAHGRLPWEVLFQPAIKLAEKGFAVSPRLNGLLKWRGPERFDAAARRYFFDDDGKPRPVGYILKNPEFAQTLETIAAKGAKAFYDGEIAQAIVEAVRTAPRLPGKMTLKDLKDYKAIERAPVCASYRGYKVCSMGPPSSGGIAVVQVLQLLEPFDLGTEPLDPRALHLIAEAQKLAYADRLRYLGDPDFVDVPRGLLDPQYLAGRRKLIDPGQVMTKAEPGTPGQVDGPPFGQDSSRERPGTSHISIIDERGDAIAMTTTIESAFGALIMTKGFLLNNELTDFSFRPRDKQGRLVANRVEPGKRPRSSMSPTIVLDHEGKVWAVLGSSGGSRIILYVLKDLIGLIDWKLDAQSAPALANFGSRNGPLEVETSVEGAKIGAQMALKSHAIRPGRMTSGSHIIVVGEDGFEGGADPRREGVALGD
jgi:gamma-glutamyltranspeptidase/glutathione hydrolase